jgi:hypothetical protein
VGLGNHRGEGFVPGIDGESFELIGGLREDHRMQAHPDKVIAQGAEIHAMVEALEPAPGILVVIDLMLGTAAFSLGGPSLEELVLIEDVGVILCPLPEGLSARAVDGTQTTQLPEVLRELRDFR